MTPRNLGIHHNGRRTMDHEQRGVEPWEVSKGVQSGIHLIRREATGGHPNERYCYRAERLSHRAPIAVGPLGPRSQEGVEAEGGGRGVGSAAAAVSHFAEQC